jgi:hypothetical protein
MMDFHWRLGAYTSSLSVNGQPFGEITLDKESGKFFAICHDSVSQEFLQAPDAMEWLADRARIGHQGVLRAGLWRPEAATDTPSQPDPEAPDIQGRLGPRVGGGYSGGPNMGER